MANSGLNSFSENMRQVIIAQTNQLSLLTAFQKSMTDNAMYTTYNFNEADNTYHEFQLPTFASIHNRITNIENSLESLLTGRGTITTDDMTRFRVTIKTVPTAPNNISYLQDPTMFYTDPNWIFEDFMFPAAKIRINLTNQISDTCKQIHYRRIIVDSSKVAAQVVWNNKLRDYRYTYPELINLLQDTGIDFYEDTQTVDLPHSRNTTWGIFQIMDDPTYENGVAWYTLDTINYSNIDINGTDLGSTNTLEIGSELIYNGALFEIIDIRKDLLQIRLKCINGVATPGMGSQLQIYNNIQLKDRYIDIKFGAHEYNFIFLKAVSPDYNILSNTWSQCVKFSSDDLTNMENGGQTFKSFYESSVYDWGAELLANAKEKKVPAYMGVIPNTPVLNASDFKVSQINIHINNSGALKDLELQVSEIERAKSHIDSLNITIRQLRSDLVKTTSVTEYKSLQDNIQLNLQNLETAQQSYASITREVKNNTSVNRQLKQITPKYRVRGFFTYPEPVYYDAAKTREQTVIGFEIAYRYLSENKQAASLQRYEYKDVDDGVVDAIFSDWNIVQTKLKEKKYNNTTDKFEWVDEATTDSSVINANQIDLPIQQGECVEFKIRSITEAGYPENPRKSEWSNTVVIEFPDELKGKNTLQDALEAIQIDLNRAELRDILTQDGVLSHLRNAVVATDGTGINFDHESKYIAFEDITQDGVLTTSLQSKIASVSDRLSRLETNYSKMTGLINQFDGTIANILTRDNSSSNEYLLSGAVTESNGFLASSSDTSEVQNFTSASQQYASLGQSAQTQTSSAAKPATTSRSSNLNTVLEGSNNNNTTIRTIANSTQFGKTTGNEAIQINRDQIAANLFSKLNSLGTAARSTVTNSIEQQQSTGSIERAIYNKGYTVLTTNNSSYTDEDIEKLVAQIRSMNNIINQKNKQINDLTTKVNELTTKMNAIESYLNNSNS